VNQSAHLQAVLTVGADSILSALGADSVSISRVEPGTWTLRTLVNAGQLGPSEERLPHAELYRLQDFAHFNHVFRDQRTWLTSLDDPEADRADVELLEKLGKGSSLTTPLIVDGELWGELYAAWVSPIGAVAAMHDGFLDALTTVLGGALSRAAETEALQHLAFRDPLTGLANRRALDEAARRVFDHHGEDAPPLVSVVAVDVNGLKAINDLAGHERGDRLIRAIATQLLHSFKPLYGSLAARVGGDEFTVLVPGHPPPAVVAIANAFCQEARALDDSSGVACGVASCGGDAQATATELFSAADTAMYEAKRAQAATAVIARPLAQTR
jgi:diguanylate cyclase (GGDEF)-like protein